MFYATSFKNVIKAVVEIQNLESFEINNDLLSRFDILKQVLNTEK